MQKKLFDVIDIFYNTTNRFHKEELSGATLSGYVIILEEMYNG